MPSSSALTARAATDPAAATAAERLPVVRELPRVAPAPQSLPVAPRAATPVEPVPRSVQPAPGFPSLPAAASVAGSWPEPPAIPGTPPPAEVGPDVGELAERVYRLLVRRAGRERERRGI